MAPWYRLAACNQQIRFVRVSASIRALARARNCEAVPIAIVFPRASDSKTSIVEEHPNGSVRKLITVFGVDRFSSREVKVKVAVLNDYILRLRALEVHLNSRFNGIPNHTMAKLSGIKVRSQFSIEAMQYVQIERCSDSLPVVISSQKRSFILHHVRTEQQRISGLQLKTQISQDEACLFRRKIADTCADVKCDRGAVERIESERVSHIVPDDGL